LKFSGSDWLAVGGVAAGTGAVMGLDREIHRQMESDGRESYNGDWWDVPTVYGDFAGAGGIGVLVYGAGLVTRSEAIRVTGRVILESLCSAGLAAFALRCVTGRSRPFTGGGPWDFHGFQWAHEHQSFPSGHATAAFALSTSLAERIGTSWSRIGFYALSTITAVARVRNNQHWASDVAVGAVLGITAGFSAVNREEKEKVSNTELGSCFRILPSAHGVTVVYLLQ
jgi:membrane-associated phospholipid phosphatase